MLRAVRHIILGPPQASIKRIQLLRRTKPHVFTPMEEGEIATALASLLKYRILGTAVALTSVAMLPAFPILGYSTLGNWISGLFIYRCVSFGTWSAVEKKVGPYVDKYELETRPDLVLTSEEYIEAKSKEMKEIKEMRKKRRAERRGIDKKE